MRTADQTRTRVLSRLERPHEVLSQLGTLHAAQLLDLLQARHPPRAMEEAGASQAVARAPRCEMHHH